MAALGVAGCPSDDDLPDSVRQRIGPDGGQISSADQILTIFIPPGALESEVEVVVSRSDTPPESLGQAYRVQPDIELEVPAEISYQDALPPNVAGVTVGAIHKDDFEAGRGSWTPLPRIAIDEQAGLVVATDDELSLFYGLLGDGGVAGTGSTGPEPSSGTTGGMETTTGDPTVDPSETGGETEGETEPAMLSHAADIQPIWDQNCVSACHEPGGQWAALDLSGDAYDDIIGMPSLVASANFIEPGFPQDSYLLHKLDGTYNLDENSGGCGCNGGGALMPLGAAQPLSPAIRNTIRAWIEQGAEP